MIETLDNFFGAKVVIDHIAYGQGEQLIRRGLEFFCGKGYKWNNSYMGIADWLADNRSKGLLLTGNCGVGKTLIASKILVPFFNHHYRALYSQNSTSVRCYPAYDLEEAVTRGLGNCVVIDDVGGENIQNVYGSRVDWFSRAVDYAEQHGCLLICTTNLSDESLKERYGIRTYDRIRTIMHPVVITGNSLRK